MKYRCGYEGKLAFFSFPHKKELICILCSYFGLIIHHRRRIYRKYIQPFLLFFSQLFDTSLDAATQMLSDTTSADNAATQPTDNDGFTLPLAVSAQAPSSKVKN